MYWKTLKYQVFWQKELPGRPQLNFLGFNHFVWTDLILGNTRLKFSGISGSKKGHFRAKSGGKNSFSRHFRSKWNLNPPKLQHLKSLFVISVTLMYTMNKISTNYYSIATSGPQLSHFIAFPGGKNINFYRNSQNIAVGKPETGKNKFKWYCRIDF